MIDWDAFKSQLNANPRKMLGFVLALSVCFLVIWGIVVFQAGGASRPITDADQADARLDGLRRSLDTDSLSATYSNTLSFTFPDTGGTTGAGDESLHTTMAGTGPAGQDTGENRSMVLVILVGFLAVSGGLWWWARKDNGDTDPMSYVGITTIATRELAAGQQLMIMEVNGEIWILGVGPQGSNLLHRYEKGDWNMPGPVQEEDNDFRHSRPTGEVDGKGWNEAWLSGLVNQQAGS